MKSAPAEAPASVSQRGRVGGWEWLGIAALAGLAAVFLAVSWRRWPDPLIDFGRELYLPWRLANGAVLYRDVDDFYGPLSQYLNAALFRLFGPGLMVLATANLVVFAGIVALLYRLFRRAWGAGAAWVAAAIFVAVFGFSQSVGIGNYNYATPYAHEVTHGLLVSLLLVHVLVGWIESATPRRSFLAGLLLGLSALLKPEIVLAAGLVSAAAFVAQRRSGRPLGWASVGAWLAGVVLPTAGFAAYFSRYTPWGTAWDWASRAWLNAATSTRFTGDPVQRGFLGFDQPGQHVLEHGVAALVALLLIGLIASAAWLANRAKADGARIAVVGAAGTLVAALAGWALNWNAAGKCLLGLMLVFVAMSAVKVWRRPAGADTALRLLLAVLALALLGRMLLNGRLHQFGFYQAALAAVLMPAVLLGELPERLGGGRWSRVAALVGCLALVGPGVVKLVAQSRDLLRLKTHVVGEGGERFMSFPPDVYPTGALVGQTAAWLREAAKGRPQTLLVLPEGEMINYLARMPSPVAPFFFYSAATSGGREARIVDQLQRNPPDWIVLISRDLREYGVQRYGESVEQGGQILDWAADRYEVAATFGGDPLDYRQRGVMILRRRR